MILFRWEMPLEEVMEYIRLGPGRRPWRNSNAVCENVNEWRGKHRIALELRLGGR